MGIYTTSFIFYGVVVDKIGYTQLVDSKEYKEMKKNGNRLFIL